VALLVGPVADPSPAWCRLSWGGSQASEYLLKLMQLKYPTFPGRLSTFQANDIYKSHSYHATDYPAELRALADARNLAAADRTIQFPFALATSTEQTEEELARQLEKRKESGRRLQEQAAKQRLERMGKQEEELRVFGEVRDSKASLSKVDFEVSDEELGVVRAGWTSG
jgi:actin-related protein 5